MKALSERISAKLPMPKGKLYHVEVEPGEVPRYVLLPGDPGRVNEIASEWDEAKVISFHREFKVAKGKYKGVEVAAVSTGIGGPSTSIAIEELLYAGADTFIRVGTTGAIQPYISVGDLVIACAAVRYDGASLEYAPPEYPAAASYDVVLALVEAADSIGVRYHVGVVASTSTFYVGQSRPGYRGYTWSLGEQRMKDLQRMGVLSFEMEAATIYTLASIYGARAGCVCAAIANRVTDEFKPGAGVREAIRVANEAVKILHEWDEEKQRRGKKYLTASVVAAKLRA